MTNSRASYVTILLSWLLLVSIGYLIGLYLGLFLTNEIGDYIAGFLTLALVGLLVGLGEWIVIRSWLYDIWGWIPATTVGFSIGSVISFIIVSSFQPPSWQQFDNYFYVHQWIEMSATLTATGIFTGALQWLSLKRKFTTSLGWLLVSGLSLAIAYEIAYYWAQAPRADSLFGSIQYDIIFAVIFGLLTGAFAEPLLLRPEFRSL